MRCVRCGLTGVVSTCFLKSTGKLQTSSTIKGSWEFAQSRWCYLHLQCSPPPRSSLSPIIDHPKKWVSKNARRNTCSEDRNLFSRGSLQIMLSCPSPMSHRKKQWQNLGPDFLSICCASFPPLRFEIYPIETGSLLVKPRSQNVDS